MSQSGWNNTNHSGGSGSHSSGHAKKKRNAWVKAMVKSPTRLLITLIVVFVALRLISPDAGDYVWSSTLQPIMGYVLPPVALYLLFKVGMAVFRRH